MELNKIINDKIRIIMEIEKIELCTSLHLPNYRCLRQFRHRCLLFCQPCRHIIVVFVITVFMNIWKV